MALAQGHPVGQPLDIGSQAMHRRQPNWARRLAGHAKFAPTDLRQDVHRRGVRGKLARVLGEEIMGKSAATKTLLPTVGPASWLGVSSGMRSNELRNVRGRGRRERHAPKIYL